MEILEQIAEYVRQQVELYGDEPVLPMSLRRKAGSESAVAIPEEEWRNCQTLDSLYGEIKDCLKCPLGQARTRFVFGDGNPNAEIVLVGEAPGAEEDRQGVPFVGQAGQLLDKILQAINLRREQVYICNIVKCRPPENRVPNEGEIAHCQPYLLKQLQIIKPAFVLCLGRTAAQALLQTTASLSVLRGKVHLFNGAKLLVTYHPAALLRTPEYKRDTWEDVKLLRKLYDDWKNTQNAL
jgi:uracil-DNA glycosylase family 4